jgi:dTDP-4-dehydrorhamnose reductase
VIRISNPYRAHPIGKKDFVHKMIEQLESKKPVFAPTDQLFTPTFIDDIASALRLLVQTNAHGIYHVVGTSALSPFDAAIAIADAFDCDKALVKPARFARMFQSRAPAPQNAVLKNDKIRALGATMRTFTEGLLEVKSQEI